MISRWGSLWDAVATSFAIPVLAPAQVRGRRILVDGSLVDNLPLRRWPLSVRGRSSPWTSRPRSGGPRGVRQRSSADGQAEPELRTPSLGETLARVLLLGSSNTSETARRHADWTITPRSEGVGLLEFHQLDQSREAGGQPRARRRERPGEHSRLSVPTSPGRPSREPRP